MVVTCGCYSFTNQQCLHFTRQSSYQPQSFAHNEDDILIRNRFRGREKEVSRSDVNEGDRSNDRES